MAMLGFLRWVIMVRSADGKRFDPYPLHNTIAYQTKAHAYLELRAARAYFGRGNVYLQKYGPIS